MRLRYVNWTAYDPAEDFFPLSFEALANCRDLYMQDVKDGLFVYLIVKR